MYKKIFTKITQFNKQVFSIGHTNLPGINQNETDSTIYMLASNDNIDKKPKIEI